MDILTISTIVMIAITILTVVLVMIGINKKNHGLAMTGTAILLLTAMVAACSGPSSVIGYDILNLFA